jgi:hypothetical protein
MEPLQGPERLILQAVHDLQGDTAAFIEDRAVAQRVKMDLDDVRNCFVVLEGRGYVNTARTTDGRSASIIAEGRLALKQWEANPGAETGRAAHPSHIAVRPKGLLSFDQRDADFFLQLLPGPRDKNGLPDSVRYWKSRIEERDTDHSYSTKPPSASLKSNRRTAASVSRSAGT